MNRNKADKQLDQDGYYDGESFDHEKMWDSMKSHSIEFAEWISKDGWITDNEGNYFKFDETGSEIDCTTEQLYNKFNSKP